MEAVLAKMGRKYGSAFLADLNRLSQDPVINGSLIAKKYGISRERIRQICDLTYGKGFLSWRKEKLQGRKKFFSLMKRYKSLSRKGHLRSQALYSTFERLEELGLWPQINCDARLSEISLKNGKLIKVRWVLE